MSPRERQVADFLAASGWAEAARTPLAGDASTRRYLRLARGRETAVLMDAPSPSDRTPQFVTVAALLRDVGLSAPVVHAADTAAGLVLLEDFGDRRFGDRIDAGDGARALLALAVDVLIALHRKFDASAAEAHQLPRFDPAMFQDQLTLFAAVVLPRAGVMPSQVVTQDFQAAWAPALGEACQVPRSLLLRDYFADNLMWLDERPGLAACGLLDFQDAGIGPVSYDLMSLIDDARRDIPEETAEFCRRRYLDAFREIDPALFELSCHVLAAARALRIIAVFLRLESTGRPGYAVHLPRVWRQFDRHLRHPALAPLAAWFNRHLPADRRPLQ